MQNRYYVFQYYNGVTRFKGSYQAALVASMVASNLAGEVTIYDRMKPKRGNIYA